MFGTSPNNIVEDYSEIPTGGRLKQWLAGVVLPFWPILFGVCSLLVGRATFFGKNGSADIQGRPAIALNLTYISIGLFLHFHYFWGLDSNLHRHAQGLKIICLAVCIPCLLYALYQTLWILS